jgi:predicted metal-dependent hydrolase
MALGFVLAHRAHLLHLRRMDHSRRFWKLVAAACPDYQRARAWLRANGSSAGGLRTNSPC